MSILKTRKLHKLLQKVVQHKKEKVKKSAFFLIYSQEPHVKPHRIQIYQLQSLPLVLYFTVTHLGLYYVCTRK